MNYLLESILSGIYSCILYFIVNELLLHITTIHIGWLFFIVGFLKHALGYLFNIHKWYCVYGNACISYKNKNVTYTPWLWLECIGEGILYVLMGNIIGTFIPWLGIVFFVIGALLHIIFEYLTVHSYFCKYRCY
jgi:hypothetical protein